MFISKAEKEDIHKRLSRLEEKVGRLMLSVDALMMPAPYGRKKDGSPRSKPGRKTVRKGLSK